MKALSIHQPWAWLIVNGFKDVENRSRRTSHRGLFLIHASKDMTGLVYRDSVRFVQRRFGERIAQLIPAAEELERGGIVGRAVLADCLPAVNSPWFTGPYGYVLQEAESTLFVPLKGQRGFFDVPEVRS